jgi:hypothetical protein
MTSKPARWGVFVYDPKGMYLQRDALFIYKLESAAEKKADRLFSEGQNVVSRPMWCYAEEN